MSRPTPLGSGISSGQYRRHDGEITPRTPHSRSGRAEEAYTEIELEEVDDEHPGVRQPLLNGQGSGYRSHGDDYNSHQEANVAGKRKQILSLVMKRTPLVIGSLCVVLLVFLIVVSYRSPDAIHEYLATNSTANANVTDSEPESLILDYSSYNFTEYPLDSREYRRVCSDITPDVMKMRGYWVEPPMGVKDVVHKDRPEEAASQLSPEERICSGTITYMLDHYVGLSADLALIAQTAALARERNKTFLIDDSRWDRGNWSDYFEDVRKTQPGPEPGCKPPPPDELVPCPRLARHWVVNAETTKYHFGHAFSGNYEDPYGMHLHRLHPIYNMAAESFQTTIVPNERIAQLIARTRHRLETFIKDRNGQTSKASSMSSGSPAASAYSGTSYMAVHIRRGDRKDGTWAEYKHNGGYVPLEDYAAAVNMRWKSLYLSAYPESENTMPDPVVYIASDSLEATRQFEKLVPSKTTFSLDTAGDRELETLVSTSPYVQSQFAHFKSTERARLTEGMLVDMALLSGFWGKGALQPESVVCTISSNVCKLAAVGLGWDRAFGNLPKSGDLDRDHARWVEVQDKNRIYPQWEAFEIFY